MKVAYVTIYDHADIHGWSGTGYHIAQCLANAGLQLSYISNLKTRLDTLFKVKTVLYRKLLRRQYIRCYQPMVSRYYARQVEQQVAQLKPDVIFSPGVRPIAYVRSSIPIIYWADATFAGLTNFYREFCNLSRIMAVEGNRMHQAALSNCRLAIYSSEWAAQSAIANYDVDPRKVKVVPFGANIECNRTPEDIQEIITNKDHTICKLLFVGVDWFRKGGNIALEVTKALNARGLPTELHVVGCKPPGRMPNFVKLYGFVSKKTAEGRNLLDRLFMQSYFHILPTQAECFGIVFAEASSFGLPSLATQVGGVPTAVIDNQNGKTFSLDNIVEQMTDYILRVISDGTYNDLCIASFNDYCNRLNWVTAGNTVNQLIHELC